MQDVTETLNQLRTTIAIAIRYYINRHKYPCQVLGRF